MGTTRGYCRYDGPRIPRLQDKYTKIYLVHWTIGQCTTTMDTSDIGYTRDKCSVPWDLVIQGPPRIGDTLVTA